MTNNNLSIISLEVLNTVTGGAASSTKQSAAIEQSLASIKTSLSDLGTKKSDSGGMNSTTMMCLGLMMANKNKQQSNNTVIAGNGAVASTWSWG